MYIKIEMEIRWRWRWRYEDGGGRVIGEGDAEEMQMT